MSVTIERLPTAATAQAVQVSRADITARLRARGIEPTRQRVDIAQCLLTEHRHLSADQLQAELARRARHSPSRATIYNTLRLLAERGLVREVVVDPHRIFFDSNMEAHHHFYETERGQLTDIPAESVRFNTLPSLPPGTTLDSVDVVLRIRSR